MRRLFEGSRRTDTSRRSLSAHEKARLMELVMTKRTSLGLLTALVLAVSMHAMLGAQQAGSNVNVLPTSPSGNSSPPFPPPGISDTDELKGDGYLQRQVEPVVAASSLNPDHLVAAFGDFRTVDIPNDIGVPGVGVG